jgi:large repetitive protein
MFTGYWAEITAVVIAMFAITSPSRAQTFSNPDPITIPLVGTATPYPSSLLVSGVTGSVQDKK